MTSPILFAGQEDLSFTILGPGFTSAVNTNGVVINTTANRFRSGYARYALDVHGNSNIANNLFLRAQIAATTQFWWTARLAVVQSNSGNVANQWVWTMDDGNGIRRIRMRLTTTASDGFTLGSNWIVEKVNAAGTATSLGNLFGSGISDNPSTPDKIDVFVNYAVSGQLAIYINGTQTFAFSGDLTTDSVTSLASVSLGCVTAGSSNQNTNAWSEVIVATRDTRNMSLVTQAATALGNTHTFTSGAVANISGNQYKDASPDYSITAGQVQQYQITPAIPAGSFSVVSVVQHGRVTNGETGPTQIDFNVRTGGTDYFSSDLAATAAWGLLTNNWDTNPNTSAAWQTTDLAASSTSFNFGYKSVA